MIPVCCCCGKDGENGTRNRLRTAFGRETRSCARYAVAAGQARKEGYWDIASLLEAVSASKKLLATRFGRVLESMGDQIVEDQGPVECDSAVAQLHDAIEEETEIAEKTCPEYIHDAETEGSTAAVMAFTAAMKADAEHARLFQMALDDLDDWRNGQRQFHVCGICGWTEEGDAPPLCPVCGATADRFIAFPQVSP